jgi:uncharacterized membrane protein HdeD (DUF308 family)
MEAAVSRSRRSLAVRGFLALALGVAVLAWPHLTLAILVLGFAIYAIGDGVFAITIAMSRARQEGLAWRTYIEGLLSLAAGLFVLFAPAPAARMAFLGIGLWAIATGLLQLTEGPERQKEGEIAALQSLSGLVRVFFGVVLVLARRHGGPATLLVLLLAVYAFSEGILMLGLAFGGKPRGPVLAQPV